jgi:hypothetical protein
MLVGEHLLLRNFGPYGTILMNVCFVITVAMVMLLRDLRPCGTMTVYVQYFTFPIILDGQFISPL